ncbi:hypothetical protein PC116_g10230 [Phytophthora cactorum]|uniref:Uncharacterized protein n=1 Tax=Phytophthora cactorum TaxID=29920 RepID=A0A8T1E1N8_9STRA|nr:hypothetical protein Pcac1_g18547 [Phytophthora cactorum]KAG2916565.1 hypothetical protein PC114_g7438 [Phytophthora cactorum]KAG2946812.1 hypothetical protein PC117_g7342 [Phytophthora cactorum]KAG3013567.1 hypothetical protein PC120_g13223 [Phytophthora cactorum]KAG3027877.1 hypothetical protein PC119_g7208 [Phytophthora cactorum]
MQVGSWVRICTLVSKWTKELKDCGLLRKQPACGLTSHWSGEATVLTGNPVRACPKE